MQSYPAHVNHYTRVRVREGHAISPLAGNSALWMGLS